MNKVHRLLEDRRHTINFICTDLKLEKNEHVENCVDHILSFLHDPDRYNPEAILSDDDMDWVTSPPYGNNQKLMESNIDSVKRVSRKKSEVCDNCSNGYDYDEYKEPCLSCVHNNDTKFKFDK